jgi:hypothetical protein
MGSADSRSTSAETEMIVPARSPVSPEMNRSRPRRQVWAIALSAGIIGGITAWFAGELAHGFFRPRLYEVQAMGMTSMQPSRQSREAADSANAMLSLALLGGVTGLIMSLAGGIACRSPVRGAMGALPALVSGAAVAVLVSMALIPFFFRGLVPDTNDLLTPIMIHGGIWMAIGAVGGLAFAVGMGRRHHFSSALGAACVGAFLASVLYHLIDAGLFPDSNATEPISNSRLVRLLSSIIPAVFIALGAARGSLGRERETKASKASITA